MKYAVIDNIKVRGFQAMQTPTIVSAAPVFAGYMFSHALLEKMSQGLMQGFTLHGVSMILHEARMDMDAFPGMKEGEDNGVISKRGAVGYCIGGKSVGSDMGGDYSSRSVSPFSVASQPSVTASCVVSLVMKVSGFDSEKARELLRFMRFAGGSIDGFGDIKIYEDDLPPRLPPGKFFMDARAKVESRLEAGANIVEALFARDTPTSAENPEDEGFVGAAPAAQSAPENDSDKDKAEDLEEFTADRQEYVHYMPATVGYALLGDLKPRTGARLGPDDEVIPAAPAEAMVGLVGLENVYKVMNSGRNIFWEFKWGNDGDIRYCTIQQ